MKRYFVDGIEVSEEKAKEIELKNNEYLASGNFDLLLKCKFIIVVEKQEH